MTTGAIQDEVEPAVSNVLGSALKCPALVTSARLRQLATGVALSACASACGPGNPQADDSLGRAVEARCTDNLREVRFSEREGTLPLEEEIRQSHHRVVAAMQQRALPCAGGDEAYRVVRTLSLDPRQVAILVVRDRGNRILVRTTLRNRTDGAITQLSDRVITVEQLDVLKSAIHDSGFWNQPVLEIPAPPTLVLDGGTLALEGFSQGRYHVVTRPVDASMLSKVSQIAFALSGVDAEQIAVREIFGRPGVKLEKLITSDEKPD